MKPYYEEKGITIYHGDCREVMPRICKVDLLLTDPPYGIGISSNPFRQKYARTDWDAKRPDPMHFMSMLDGSKQAIIWGGNYFADMLPPAQRWLVWDKEQPEDFSSAMCEMAWTNLSGPAKMFRKRVVQIQKYHPTTKPFELMQWCVNMAENPQTILDPFMGSGTTLRAAKDLGRQAIGIEIEEKYCEIAVKRLAQEVFPL